MSNGSPRQVASLAVHCNNWAGVYFTHASRCIAGQPVWRTSIATLCLGPSMSRQKVPLYYVKFLYLKI